MRTAIHIALMAFGLTAFCAIAQACEDGQGCAAETAVSWGGSLRFRLEGWRGFAFQPEADDAFVLGRLTMFADINVGQRLRVFVEGKSALSSERDLPGGTRALDVDTIALQKAYIEVRPAAGRDVSLRIGRQALSFGRQRLVSPLPWGNSLRAWDGALLNVSAGDAWQVQAFYTWFVPVNKYDRNRRDKEQPFLGVNATWLAGPDRGLQTYWLRRDRESATYNGTTGPERRDTLGVRLFHQTGPWRADLEVAWQDGRVGTGDIDAHMAAVELLRFWETGAIESASIGFDFASGDRSPGGDVETFSHLYPLGHAYLGYMDFIGRQNVAALFLRGRFRVTPESSLEVTATSFARARRSDGLYNAGGGLLRAPVASAARRVGDEFDLRWSRALGSGGLLVGYSHFFPSKFISASGASASSDFAYAQYSLHF